MLSLKEAHGNGDEEFLWSSIDDAFEEAREMCELLVLHSDIDGAIVAIKTPTAGCEELIQLAGRSSVALLHEVAFEQSKPKDHRVSRQNNDMIALAAAIEGEA